MTSEVDTREVERRCLELCKVGDNEPMTRQEALYFGRILYYDAAQAIAQERAARERAEAALGHISENSDDVYDVSLANKVLSQRGSHD
jgi:hypothetical protein